MVLLQQFHRGANIASFSRAFLVLPKNNQGTRKVEVIVSRLRTQRLQENNAKLIRPTAKKTTAQRTEYSPTATKVTMNEEEATNRKRQRTEDNGTVFCQKS